MPLGGRERIGEHRDGRMPLGYRYADTDSLIRKQENRSISDIFESDGEEVFRDIEKTILEAELPNNTHTVYSCGGGVVIQEENRHILRKNSLIICLYASIDTCLDRIKPGTRPLLNVINPRQRAEEMLRMRLDLYVQTADIIFSSEDSAEVVVERIYEEIHQAINY